MTKIRLDLISPSGMEDVADWSSIYIDKSTYMNLPIFPKIDNLFDLYSVTKTTFSDNVRNTKDYVVNTYPAFKITGKQYSAELSLYIVWIKSENVWIVFECEDYFYGEYGPLAASTLKVEQIFRPNDSMKELIKKLGKNFE